MNEPLFTLRPAGRQQRRYLADPMPPVLTTETAPGREEAIMPALPPRPFRV